MLDDPLVHRIGDDQHQIRHSLSQVGADHVGVEQAERKDQVLAGDAVVVSDQFAGMDNGPHAQPGSIGCGPVVPREAADEPRQQGMKQPGLGNLWAEQHQDTIPVLGLLDMLRIDSRGRQSVPNDAVQPCPHSSAGDVASLQSAEALNVECKDGPMFWFCAHRLTCPL
jgi:hypothetical protein